MDKGLFVGLQQWLLSSVPGQPDVQSLDILRVVAKTAGQGNYMLAVGCLS
jgi:hypothetical protein